MKTATAKGGEVLDEIVALNYPSSDPSAALKEVLEANKGLADLALSLPEGTAIVLPDLSSGNAPAPSLWD